MSAKHEVEPVISIVIPVYNAERYLRRCLDSLLQQNHAQVEVLCVNDGSTDQSAEILSQYEQNDARIKVFHQQNSGPGAARNQGLEAATGHYLMFCDTDDWYEPHMCQRMLETMRAADVDLVVCASHTRYEDESYQRGDDVFHEVRFYGYYQVSDACRNRPNIVLWNKIYKRELIEQYQIRFAETFIGEDDSFIFQYMSVASSVYGLNEKLHNRSLREESVFGSLQSTVGQEAKGEDPAEERPTRENKRFHSLLAIHHNIDFLNRNHLWKSNQQHFVWSVFNIFINNVKNFDQTGQQAYLEVAHNILKRVDVGAFDLPEEAWGWKELQEIKKRDFSRYFPVRKEKGALVKERVVDTTHYYLFGVKVYSKKRTRYSSEIRLFGVRVLRRSYELRRLSDQLQQIDQYLKQHEK